MGRTFDLDRRHIAHRRGHQRRAGVPRSGGRVAMTRGRRGSRFNPLRHYGLIALAVVMALAARAYWVPDIALPGFDSLHGTTSPSTMRHFSICARGPRSDCVVDGDTFYFGDEKVRIADIDTPEVFSPKCAAEKARGDRATARLHALLNAGPISLEATARAHDVYGRRLAVVTRNGRSLGDTLVTEGLAHRWHGRRESWC